MNINRFRRTFVEHLELRCLLAVAVDDTYSIAPDQTLYATNGGPLGNDSFAPLNNKCADPNDYGEYENAEHYYDSYSFTSSPESGTFTPLDPDVWYGTVDNGGFYYGLPFTYTPEPGFTGSVSFGYTISDWGWDEDDWVESTSNATVTINVYQPPVAGDDSYGADPDSELIVGAPGVLGNDSGASLTAAVVDQPAHGILTLDADGGFDYVPNGGYEGPDSFTYYASDGVNTSNTATATITVGHAPVALDDTLGIIVEGQAIGFNVSDLLANDSDEDSDPLNLSIVDQPARGTLTPGDNGAFIYTSAMNVAETIVSRTN